MRRNCLTILSSLLFWDSSCHHKLLPQSLILWTIRVLCLFPHSLTPYTTTECAVRSRYLAMVIRATVCALAWLHWGGYQVKEVFCLKKLIPTVTCVVKFQCRALWLRKGELTQSGESGVDNASFSFRKSHFGWHWGEGRGGEHGFSLCCLHWPEALGLIECATTLSLDGVLYSEVLAL